MNTGQSIYHYRRYGRGEVVTKLKTVGFKIEYIKRLNFLGAVGWWVAGKLLKDETVGGGKIKFFNLIAPLFLSIEELIEPPIGTLLLVIAEKNKK